MATVQDIEARLTAYRNAETAILTGGQEFEVSAGPDGRRIRRGNLPDIQKAIKQLEQDLALAIARESNGRTRTASPVW